jgi:hypothetical protein
MNQQNSAPIACSLSGGQRAERRHELESLFDHAGSAQEVDGGYEIVFPGAGRFAEDLAQFVAFERECCPFLTFELRFEKQQGPIRLSILGPPEARDFIRETFGSR